MGKIIQSGYFAIGIYHCKTNINIGTLWRTAHSFGANFIFTIGRRYKRQASDTTNSSHHIPLFEYVNFDSFKSNLPKMSRLVAVEIDNEARLLNSYIHPKQAIYILGAEDTGIPEDILNKCHDIIKIPVNYCLNVPTAGSIVLYDRIAKSMKY